jgi:hypothetical protein
LEHQQGAATDEPRGMRPLVAHCHLGLGKLHRRIGPRQQAVEHLTCHGNVPRDGMPFWLDTAEGERAQA